MNEPDLDSEIERLAARLALRLSERELRITTAESCTGGWVAMALTAIPGSSTWFDRGFVTYSNRAKQEMLGVRSETLERHGAVSEQTVAEMTRGALSASGVDLSLAISGIAGPGGGMPDKPVGTVCFAWQFKQGEAVTVTQCFAGDRRAVRAQAVAYSLSRLLGLLENG